MKIESKLFALQTYLREAAGYLENLRHWSHNQVFNTINVPPAPPPPQPFMLNSIDFPNTHCLVESGGERDLYDYVQAVINKEVVAANRVAVTNALEWESEHYKVTRHHERVEFTSILQLNPDDIPRFSRKEYQDTKDEPRYVVGPDGTWKLLRDGVKLGLGLEGINFVMKLRLSFAKSAIENDTMDVSLNWNGNCLCTIEETLALGRPKIPVHSTLPLNYVTKEEFDANFELVLPGSLIDHQERLKERVIKVFRELMPVGGRLPPSSRLTGEFRINKNGRSDTSLRLATSTTSDYVERIHGYDEEQIDTLIRSGAFPVYMKLGGGYVIGFTESGLDWLLTTTWDKLSIKERLELYVAMLSLLQHNHLGDYSTSEIFKSLDTIFETRPA